MSTLWSKGSLLDELVYGGVIIVYEIIVTAITSQAAATVQAHETLVVQRHLTAFGVALGSLPAPQMQPVSLYVVRFHL
jgi:hypothetical protein